MNILVIDDEKAILNTVYSQLCSMNLGMERIDVANGTEEAWKLMQNFFYDIYLCDIVMPGEDGITFAKRVLEKYSEIKFVFLTAHGDFNYMKAAISMQSFDYLLQPASKEELKNVVERAISQIKIEKKNEELMKTGTFFSNYEDNILEDRALKYLKGEIEEKAYLQRLITSKYRLNDRKIIYIPLLVQILGSKKNLEQMERPLRRSVYYNIMDEIMNPLKMVNVLMLNENGDNFYVILCMQDEDEPERARILEKLETLKSFFEKHIQSKVAIFFGENSELNGLRKSSQLIFQAEKNNVCKESKIFQPMRNGNVNVNYSFESQLVPWKKLLEQKKFIEFQQSVFNYIHRYSTRTDMNMEYMVKLHRSITELILGYLVNNSIDSDLVFDQGLPYLKYMDSWNDLDTFQETMSYIVKKLISLSHLPKIDIIEETIRYIRQNIDKNITVSELADYIGINPEYYTKLFKRKTGYNLKEYITNEKMKTAKMLMTTTDLSVTMISDHVGYNNYSNFTRSFKQIVGCTPMDYRKLMMNQ